MDADSTAHRGRARVENRDADCALCARLQRAFGLPARVLFDNPVRDPHILHAPDGFYYMVATAAKNTLPDSIPARPDADFWWFNDGIPDISIASGAGFNDGKPHLAIFTRERASGDLKLWVDGQLAASGRGGTQSLNSPAQLGLGAQTTGENPLSGDIGEVQLYARILTGAQRQQSEQKLMKKWGIGA